MRDRYCCLTFVLLCVANLVMLYVNYRVLVMATPPHVATYEAGTPVLAGRLSDMSTVHAKCGPNCAMLKGASR